MTTFFGQLNKLKILGYAGSSYFLYLLGLKFGVISFVFNKMSKIQVSVLLSHDIILLLFFITIVS